jgi:hypothetical protein
MKATTSSRDGFALLLAVTLLSFLMLLLIGLGTYARLESTSVGVATRQAQARELALMAQQIALSRLQLFAGPDQRVTATSGAGLAHPSWTGVWSSTDGGAVPLTWLVSGNESSPFAMNPRDAIAADNAATMVGATAPGTGASVVAPLISVVPNGSQSHDGDKFVGRYAWWVGDQGVKAPVAHSDRTELIAYVPYDSADVRARLRQQLSLGAAANDGVGETLFDPQSAANEELLRPRDLVASSQLALLRTRDEERVGFERVREHFHQWSVGNAAVLANTRSGGLRQDLSLRPDILGPGFEAWMKYANELEPTDAVAPVEFSIFPGYGPEPIRRRHRIAAPVGDSEILFTNAPVLAAFFLQFNVRRIGGNSASTATSALEVRARMVTQLWNPWTTSIVPEPLQLEVTGLPDVVVRDTNGGSQVVALKHLFGSPMTIELTPEDAAFPGDPDDCSWLPGRVYAWRSRGGAPGAWLTEFYNRTLSVPNANVWAVPAGVAYAAPASNAVQLSVTAPATELTLVLKQADGTALWQVRSPQFAAFSTTPQKVNANDEYRFGFPIRMIDPVDTAAAPTAGHWLTGSDPRALESGEPLFRFGSGGDMPSAYVGVGGNSVLTDENRLFDRVMGRTGMSYNEDVPVFELPRSPPLSVGQLQHLSVAGRRPFSIGNSWGADAVVQGIPALELFDRLFFSGLAPGVEPVTTGGKTVLPQQHLRTTEPRVGIAQLRKAPEGFSSKFLLQDGAFNLNSTSVAAWIAMLRSGRIVPEKRPTYLDASAKTGSSSDAATATIPAAYAAFYRFPHSAQETFKADAGYAASDAEPPDEPGTASLANTHLYRRGVRVLEQAEVVMLAEAIVRGITDRRESSGPFRSVAEFLGPQAEFEGRSVIEHALLEAGTNAHIPEFSSQHLTQGDIMTLLAPILFARSDTFIIRSYGEIPNPMTGAIEARAWCETQVQRMPEFFDTAGDVPETPVAELASADNRRLGRRFKFVSFRWLTRFDL